MATLEDLADRYVNHCQARLRPASLVAAKRSLEVVTAVLGPELDPAALRPRHLDEFVGTLKAQKRRAAGINRDLRYLKAALRLAVEDGTLDKLPCKVQLLRETRTNPTWLEPTEVEKLLAAASPSCRPVIQLGLFTGMRVSELIELDWGDYDGQSLHVRSKPERGYEPKGLQERVVPLGEKAVAIVDALQTMRFGNKKPLPDFPILTSQNQTRWSRPGIQRAGERAFRKAGVEGKGCWHVLRRTAARTMLQGGVDVVLAQRVLGWSTPLLAQRYVGVSEADAARAARALDTLG